MKHRATGDTPAPRVLPPVRCWSGGERGAPPHPSALGRAAAPAGDRRSSEHQVALSDLQPRRAGTVRRMRVKGKLLPGPLAAPRQEGAGPAPLHPAQLGGGFPGMLGCGKQSQLGKKPRSCCCSRVLSTGSPPGSSLQARPLSQLDEGGGSAKRPGLRLELSVPAPCRAQLPCQDHSVSMLSLSWLCSLWALDEQRIRGFRQSASCTHQIYQIDKK